MAGLGQSQDETRCPASSTPVHPLRAEARMQGWARDSRAQRTTGRNRDAHGSRVRIAACCLSAAGPGTRRAGAGRPAGNPAWQAALGLDRSRGATLAGNWARQRQSGAEGWGVRRRTCAGAAVAGSRCRCRWHCRLHAPAVRRTRRIASLAFPVRLDAPTVGPSYWIPRAAPLAVGAVSPAPEGRNRHSRSYSSSATRRPLAAITIDGTLPSRCMRA